MLEQHCAEHPEDLRHKNLQNLVALARGIATLYSRETVPGTLPPSNRDASLAYRFPVEITFNNETEHSKLFIRLQERIRGEFLIQHV